MTLSALSPYSLLSGSVPLKTAVMDKAAIFTRITKRTNKKKYKIKRQLLENSKPNFHKLLRTWQHKPKSREKEPEKREERATKPCTFTAKLWAL